MVESVSFQTRRQMFARMADNELMTIVSNYRSISQDNYQSPKLVIAKRRVKVTYHDLVSGN